VLQGATAAIQAAIYRYGGSVNQLINDDDGTTLIAAWGLPSSAHEDDAARAVCAAQAVLEGLRGLSLGGSVGITTGHAFCGLRGTERRREYAMIGAVVIRSARLMHGARGLVLVDEATVGAVRGALDFATAGTIRVKGSLEPVPTFRPRPGARRARSRASDIIGRLDERGRLRHALDALRDGAPATIFLEGEAGIGKSMLLDFCTRQARELDLTVLSGVADSVESATSYYVWRGVLRGLFDGFQGEALREEVLRRLGDDTLRSWAPLLSALLPLLSALLPLDLPDNEITAQMTGLARADTVRNLVVHLLQQTARRSPLVVLLDDGHWFDSASWALALDVTRRVKPALLVIATRPLPKPLPPEFARIVASGAPLRLSLPPRRLEVEELPQAVAEFIRERSQGNPFFSEQLAYALRDSGYLRIEARSARLTRGVTDLSALDLPDTIQGVITGRIDTLSPQQQLTLKVASAIGRVFAYRALWDVHPVVEDRPGLPDQLADMNQRDLILVDSPEPDLAYLFKHVVLQEVVYNLMSFRQRRRLHRAFALWLEERHADDVSPYLPLLAHHWKQATDDDKALHYLERAGEQALNNYANAEALRFLGEAVELVDASPADVDDDRRSRWEYWRGIALIKLSRYDESDECFRRGLGLIGHGLPTTRFGMGFDLLAQILRQVGHRLAPGILTRKTRHEEALRHAATIHQHHAECFYFHQDVLGLVHASVRTLNDAERAGSADDLARAYATMAIVGQVSGLRLREHARPGLPLVHGQRDLPGAVPRARHRALRTARRQLSPGDDPRLRSVPAFLRRRLRRRARADRPHPRLGLARRFAPDPGLGTRYPAVHRLDPGPPPRAANRAARAGARVGRRSGDRSSRARRALPRLPHRRSRGARPRGGRCDVHAHEGGAPHDFRRKLRSVGRRLDAARALGAWRRLRGPPGGRDLPRATQARSLRADRAFSGALLYGPLAQARRQREEGGKRLARGD